MNTRSFALPKGKYFFGDLSHVISDEDEWEDIADNIDNEIGEYKDQKYIIIETTGDGYFPNHCGANENVGVSSGSLGLMPTNVIDPEKLTKGSLGFIYTSEYEIKIDIQGGKGRNYAFHIYPKKDTYLIKDAIFILFDEEEVDESDFISRCPPFDKKEQDKNLIIPDELEDDDETPEKLILKCNEEIDSNPKNHAPYLERASAKKEIGDKEGALKDLMKVVELGTYASTIFYLEVSNFQIEMGDSKGALESLNKGIKKYPHHLTFYCKRASLKYKMGAQKEAVDDLQKLISIDKKYAPAYYELGLIQRRLGKHDEVIDNYTKAINLSTNNNHSLTPLGKHISIASMNINYGHKNDNGDYIKIGFEEYEKAIVIDPNNKDIYFNRAGDKYLLGDLKGARADWEKISESAEDTDALRFLNDLSEESGEANENVSDQYIESGTKKYKSGDYKDAIEDFDQAIKSDPQNADAYFKRGNAKNQLGDAQGAEEDHKKSNEINLSYMQ